ncbi:MAG: nucleoside 2-deoxyribosyltransferase [Lentisphaeria bacterium]|nr:nucleoside 2-deoxyribosyltransferase [Lentisphaeria bacterium]
MKNGELKIYFAGDLFDAKDLGGNLMLAQMIEKISGGRFRIMLPQNSECEVAERTSQSIRDIDFELLCKSDIIIANFDGHDLDSGTVVEFCFAKMLDIPAVLLRTDFRDSGDHTLPDGEPWNLMCSHYPRTEVLHINGMVRYHEALLKAPEKVLEHYYGSIAAEVVSALEKVITQPSWLKSDELLRHCQMTLKSIGGTLETRFAGEKLQQLVAAKTASGLYR